MMGYRKCHFKGGWVTIKQLLEQNVRSSDIIWCLSGGTRVYAKTQKGGRVTPEQTAWLEHLKARGWAVAVCRGAMEAIRFLQKLGFGGWSRCSS